MVMGWGKRLADGLGRSAGCASQHCLPHNQDLDVKNGEVREAQRQQVECHRRLQLAEGELAVVRKKLEEVEGEKAHMDQQLLMYVKDFEEERKAREKEVQVIEGLQKKLAEAKSENNALRQELNRQADYIQRVRGTVTTTSCSVPSPFYFSVVGSHSLA